MKFAICNLGCKVNNYEANWYQQELSRKYEEVKWGEVADIYIINSCTVTNVAGSKSRQMMHRARKLNRNAVICVVGCYVQMEADKQDIFEDVDILVGSSHKTEIPEMIDQYLRTGEKIIRVDDLKGCSFEEMMLESYRQTRAYLKIQDGCNQFCTYCVIPYARGRERCLEPDKVVEIAGKLVENGHVELVLTGIHTGRYRYGDTDFTMLVKRLLSEVRGLKRLRISSIEMTEVTDELIDLMKNDDRIARHLHIPLQTGCDEVLKAMNRPYTTAEYLERINEIRAEVPLISISSDIIVGFPGESEENFAATKEFIREVNFSFLHVFPYAAKQHTPAAEMKNQIPEAVKRARVSELTTLSEGLYNCFIEQYPGKKGQVLFEISRNGYLQVHNSEYVMVRVRSDDESLLHRMADVRYMDVKEDYLIGELL